MAEPIERQGHLYSRQSFDSYKTRVCIDATTDEGRSHSFQIYTTNECEDDIKLRLIKFTSSKTKTIEFTSFNTKEQDDIDSEFIDLTLSSKYIIAFDTICTGWDSAKDENEKPVLYDSRSEAMIEIFTDSLCSIEGNPDHLEDADKRQILIDSMNDVIGRNDAEEMEKFLNNNQGSNYNEDFIVRESEYTEGYKTVFNLKK